MTLPSLDLDGRVVLVTGAASGIGLATAHLLVEAGATVAGADVQDGDVTPLDVTDEAQVRAFVTGAREEHGRIDGLVNCAGVGVLSDTPVPVGETEDWVWLRTLEVNLTGTFRMCRAVVPYLLEAGGGSIVNIASVMALVGNGGSAAYVASKHGVLGLTRSMALEYADQGVRVNALCPGYIDTPMVQRHLTQVADRDAEWAGLMEAHPVGRLGEAEEVAAAALFLLADAASFLTGAGVPVDGGFTAR